MLKNSVFFSVCVTIAIANISATQAQTIYISFPPKTEANSNDKVFVTFPSTAEAKATAKVKAKTMSESPDLSEPATIAHSQPSNAVVTDFEVVPTPQTSDQIVILEPVIYQAPQEEVVLSTTVPISPSASAVTPAVGYASAAPAAPVTTALPPAPFVSTAAPAWTPPEISIEQPVCFAGG